LPAAQLGRIGILATFQANQLHQLGHARLDVGFWHAGNLHRESDILAHRARPQQVEVLEHHADFQARLAQRFTLCGRDILPVNGHAAGAGFFQTVQQTNQRAFPCAAVTDNSVNLSLSIVKLTLSTAVSATFPLSKTFEIFLSTIILIRYPFRAWRFSSMDVQTIVNRRYQLLNEQKEFVITLGNKQRIYRVGSI
jgi:hypothetical protein